MQFTTHLTAAPEGGYVVTFPDIPEAITQGESEEEALSNGLDALLTALDFYFEDQRPVPAPSKPKRGERVVELPVSIAAKVLLLNNMLAAKLRPIDLARSMGLPKQEITRLLDLRHTTKIDTVAEAIRATEAPR